MFFFYIYVSSICECVNFTHTYISYIYIHTYIHNSKILSKIEWKFASLVIVLFSIIVKIVDVVAVVIFDIKLKLKDDEPKAKQKNIQK